MKRIAAILFTAVLLASFSAAYAVSSEKVVGDFSDGLAWMKKSDLYGYIDAYGNWVIEPTCESATDFSEGYAYVKRNGQRQIIDTKGNTVLAINRYGFDPVKEGLILNYTDNGSANSSWVNYVAVNEKNAAPTPPADKKFTRANSFSDGLAFVQVGVPSKYSQQNEYYAFVDHDGTIQILLEDGWFQISGDLRLGSYVESDGFVDGYSILSGDVYNTAGTRLYGEASIIIDKTGNKCYVLQTGESEHTVYNCGNGIFCVARGKMVNYSYTVDYYYYIDAYGNELTKDHYSIWDEQSRSIIPERHMPEDNLILVGIDKKGAVSPCYMDITGNVVISSQGWEDARGFSEGLAAVCKDGKWGYINSSGEYVIDPQYDEARDFSCGVAIVDTNDEWYIIDAQGNVLY